MADYLGGWKRSHMCGTLTSANLNEEVTLMGWVQRARNLGKLIFVDLRDREGIVQVVFDEDICGAEAFALAKSLSREYVLAVRGKVNMRG